MLHFKQATPCSSVSLGTVEAYSHGTAQLFEPVHDKTNKKDVRPGKTHQPGHPPSLIRVLAVRSIGS